MQISKTMGKYFVQYSKILTKSGFSLQFMMGQSGCQGTARSQKPHRLKQQLQRNPLQYLLHLLDVRTHLNIRDCYQFRDKLMTTIITWVELILLISCEPNLQIGHEGLSRGSLYSIGY